MNGYKESHSTIVKDSISQTELTIFKFCEPNNLASKYRKQNMI